MFTVKTPEEVREILRENVAFEPGQEEIFSADALGRVLAGPVFSYENIPDFNRSMVDGYAVKSADTFGCTDALPALLTKNGEVVMGKSAGVSVEGGTCASVPTGGEIPEGADAVVMIEYTEDYGDGTIGILKPCAPGENIIFRGDDLKAGQQVLPAGLRLRAQEIGALSSMGRTRISVLKKIRVGILSTGDELIPEDQKPGPGQIRDVNSALLRAMIIECGAEPVCFGILPDRKEELQKAFMQAVHSCDMVLLSGGSSVGVRDLTCEILEASGRILFHGISMKPGKPTIFGLAARNGESTERVPVFGLPGHPGAAFFVARIFIRPLLKKAAALPDDRTISARLRGNIGANHGREQYMAVFLETEGGMVYARPVHTKSGLITGAAGADGYFSIPRDTEGLAADTSVTVTLF